MCGMCFSIGLWRVIVLCQPLALLRWQEGTAHLAWYENASLIWGYQRQRKSVLVEKY